jgi:hypothetical protein
MRTVCIRPTYGNPVTEVLIQPPLDEGEEKLMRIKAQMYGKELLMLAHSDRATTCQFLSNGGNVDHMLQSVVDPFNDNLADIHVAEEGSSAHSH